MTIVTGENLIPAKIYYLDKIIGFAASLLPAPHLLNILLCVSGLKRPDLFTLKLVGAKLRASNLIFNNLGDYKPRIHSMFSCKELVNFKMHL